MKKIFVSVPFRNRTKERIEASIGRFEEMARNILSFETPEELIFVNNYDYERKEDIPHPTLDCWGEALKRMATCDYMICPRPNAHYSKGCDMEWYAASKMGMDILYVDIDLVPEFDDITK